MKRSINTLARRKNVITEHSRQNVAALIYSVLIWTCCHLSDHPNFASKATRRMIYGRLEIDRYFVFSRVYEPKSRQRVQAIFADESGFGTC